MQTESEIRAYIMLKATEAEAFRARLLADPKGTVEAEMGFIFSADYTLHVHEETATDAHDPAHQPPNHPRGFGDRHGRLSLGPRPQCALRGGIWIAGEGDDEYVPWAPVPNPPSERIG